MAEARTLMFLNHKLSEVSMVSDEKAVLVYERGGEQPLTVREQKVVDEALGVLEARVRKGPEFSSPCETKRYCQLQLSLEKDEVFACLFLDSKHRLIQFEPLFRGSVDSASVYSRVIVRRALELNCAAIIFSHNHPSGDPAPSQADVAITGRLKSSLELIDVRVLDHIVVGIGTVFSFAERGLV